MISLALRQHRALRKQEASRVKQRDHLLSIKDCARKKSVIVTFAADKKAFPSAHQLFKLGREVAPRKSKSQVQAHTHISA